MLAMAMVSSVEACNNITTTSDIAEETIESEQTYGKNSKEFNNVDTTDEEVDTIDEAGYKNGHIGNGERFGGNSSAE